ncbi:hypothetical protein A9Z40_02990 [Microbacterium arborescens]|uniref:HNH endonuclease n=2 Tax=Microbacterium arborescens TaxID=33883 RepID=A0ABX2WIQ6_9MICO|nr:hypothetical protein A9Z40_02990 [Microbacterium arborescens]
MGGNPVRPGYADGLAACAVCNARFESDLQGKALRLGWKVRRWVRNPADVPYFHEATGHWYALAPDAPVRHPITIRQAARMMLAAYGPEGMQT